MKILIILIIYCFSSFASAFPIPKDNKVIFDIIRKNKVIGNVETTFTYADKDLIVDTTVNIKVKALFIPVYKFFQESKEVWRDGNFVEFVGHTKFEDEREYFITGVDKDNTFIANGMDGELILDKNILPLNYWNKNILYQKELFDVQKGIVRKIKVKKLNDEFIKINDFEIETEKYIFSASSNPKDKGPFPQYTIWYSKNAELIKFKFINWKDKREVITQRKYGINK